MKKSILPFLFTFLFTGCASLDISDMIEIGKGAFESREKMNKASEKLSPRQEYYLGRVIAANVLSDNPLLKTSFNSYLNELGQYLALHSQRPITFNGYRFAVIDSKIPTAMAAPGGTILISKSLLLKIRTEDELAGILAHEIAHVALDHARLTISQKRNKEVLASLGKLGMNIAGKLSNSDFLTENFDLFSGLADNLKDLSMKGYDRRQELDADQEAIQILKRAGYNSRPFVQYLERYQKESGGLWSTHPSDKDRIQAVQNLTYQDQPSKERDQRFLEQSKKL